MSELNFIFYLWRAADLTPEAFARYYNDLHMPLVASTVSPPPLMHTRSFPNQDGSTDLPSSWRDVLSFDSFTAVTFASETDFTAWGRILAEPANGAPIEQDEAQFTQLERRINLVVDVVQSSSADRRVAPGEARVLRFGRRRSGIAQGDFRSRYETEIAAIGTFPGVLRHTRYYPKPDHPLSYARNHWNEDIRSTFDVVEEILSSDLAATTQYFSALRAMLDHSSVLDEGAIVIPVWQVTALPDAWLQEDERTYQIGNG